MDDTFIETLEALVKTARDSRPDVSAGFGGTQRPGAVTGYDFWRWSKMQTFTEPYNAADSREILRSFPPERNAVKCMFPNPANRKLVWWQLAHGDRGVMLWSFDDLIKEANGKCELADAGKMIAPSLHKLRDGVGRFVMTSDRLCEPVGLLYSQASLRASYLICGSIPDAGGSGSENDHDYSRMAFSRVMEDIGVQYKYVSYEQLEKGELAASGYRFFYLPMSFALSDAEIKSLKEFVGNGGILVADGMPGIMDEHCDLRKEGGLYDLFKVRRKAWKFQPLESQGVKFNDAAEWNELKGKTLPLYPLEAGLETQGGEVLAQAGAAPCVVHAAYGKGHCYYLNCDLGRYITLREVKSPGQQAIKDLFRLMLKQAGISPGVQIRNDGGKPGNFEIFQWQRGPARMVSIQRASDFQEDAAGGMAKKDEGGSEFDKLHVGLPAEGNVYEIIGGTQLGAGGEFTVDVPNLTGVILVSIPYKPVKLTINAKQDGAGEIVLGANGAVTCRHVVHVDWVVDGKADPAFAHNVTLDEKGGWKGVLPLKRRSIEGKGVIRIRDVVSGLTAEGELK
jgi:hypothetical protein